jgi:hypothetical protein
VIARFVTTARGLHHSYEQYLAALEVSGVRLEYCEGESYAMPGGTPAHADLAASVTRQLGNAPMSRCRVWSSDLKVRSEVTDLTTFPDVTVVRGERLVATVDRNTVTIHASGRGNEPVHRGLRSRREAPTIPFQCGPAERSRGCADSGIGHHAVGHSIVCFGEISGNARVHELSEFGECILVHDVGESAQSSLTMRAPMKDASSAVQTRSLASMVRKCSRLCEAILAMRRLRSRKRVAGAFPCPGSVDELAIFDATS